MTITLIRKPQLILFDLDDTLVGSTEIYQKCYQDMKLDLPVFTEAKTWIKTNLGSRHVSNHQRFLYFKRYLELKSQFSPEALLKMISHYEELLQSYMREQWILLQRAALFLELKKQYRLALVTNETTRTQVVKLNALDPKNEVFEFMITSEEIGAEKPDPKIFAEVFRRAGLKPQDCLMIGDSVTNDLKPLKDMGAQVIGTREFLQPESSENFPWVQDLNEILIPLSSV